MIVVIDYKTGNIGSLLNMLKKIGVKSTVSSDISVIKEAEKLILPGVGAFDAGMENLNNSGILPLIIEKVLKEKTPILGICLGMQLFSRKSQEGKLKGLGLIEAETIKFKFEESNNLRIPHMGWNTIKPQKKDSLFNGFDNETRFYFVHSYHLKCENEENVLATTNYGYDFSSIVRKENIIGVQFHPEKSHKYGMKILQNFANFY